MTRFTLIWRSMLRNRTRSFLLTLSVMVAFFVYFVLASFEYGFHTPAQGSQRLVVTNKAGNAQLLPISYYEKILGTEGVGGATYTARSRATYRTPTNYLGLVAADPTTFAAFAAAQYEISPDAVARMQDFRNGVLVGRSIAEQEGWSVGQKIILSAPGFVQADHGTEFEFEIVGIFDGKQPTDTHFVVARYDYVNAARAADRDMVSSFGIVPTAAARADDIIQAVDAAFANSAYETRTQTEAQFMKAFVSQFADISTIVRFVAGIGFLTILFIIMNTMFFAIRERKREIGVLRVIGFSKSFILCSVIAETLVLFALGLASAFSLAWLVVGLLQEPLSPIVPSIRLAPSIALSGAAIAGLLAVAAGALPAINAMRIAPTAALKES